MKNLRLGLRRFIFSYTVIVAAVVLSINGIFYKVIIPTYEQELVNVNDQALQALGSLFDKFMTSRIRQLYLSIILDEENGYLRHFDHDPRDNIWEVSQVHGALKLLVTDNSDLLQSISIQYFDMDFVNSSSGFKYLRKTDNQNPFQYPWLSKEPHDRRDAIFSSTEIVDYSNPGTEESVITWIKAFPYTHGSKYRKGSIVFNIKEDFIRALLARFSGGDEERGTFFIFDASGSLVYRNRSEGYVPENIKTLVLETKEQGTLNLHQGNSVISGILSDDGELLYLFSTTVDAFFKRSEAIKDRIIVFSILGLGISLLVIYVVSNLNYRPIREIVRYGNHFMESIALPRVAAYSDTDDFKKIQLTIKVLGDFVKTNYAIVKRSFFLELIEKRFDSNLVAEKAAYLDIHMPYDNFRVAVIFAEGSAQCLQDSPAKALERASALHLEGLYSFAVEKEFGQVAWIINYQDSAVYQRALELLSDDLASLRRDRTKGLRIAVGNAYRRIDDAWQSYTEAVKMMPYSFVYEDCVLDYATKHPGDKTTQETGVYCKKIAELLNHGDFQKICSFLEDMVDRIKSDKVPYEQIRTLLNDIVELSEFTIVTSYPAFGKENFRDLRSSLEGMARIADFISQYKTLASRYISYREEVRNTIHDEVLGRIVDYLDQHLAEPVSLRELSDHFHISYSHLSSLFNKYTGSPFPAFMMKKRMEAASRRLIESELKVADIAVSVGLNDTGYFIKQFKKHYGMTPKLYRLQRTP